MVLFIKNGFVYDPLNGVNGEKMDIAIENGKIVEKDLRPLVHRIEYYTHDEAVCIEALLSMRAGQTCRPVELLHVMFPSKRFSDFLVRRIECLRDEQGSLVSIR